MASRRRGLPRLGKNSSLWLATPAVLVVLTGMVWPLARLCAGAFSAGTEEPGSGIGRLFREGYNRRAIIHSIGFSVVVATLSVVVCLPAAVALARGRFAGRSILRGAFALPLALSGVVVGFIAVAMLGNAGELPSLLHSEWLRGSAYSLGGLSVAYLYFEIPRATLTMETALGAVEEGLLEAARTLGARPWQTARLVLWPLCPPAVRAAFGVTFAASLGSFGVALILAVRFPLLPVELYRAFTGTFDDSLAGAMAMVLIAIAIAVLSVTTFRNRRQ